MNSSNGKTSISISHLFLDDSRGAEIKVRGRIIRLDKDCGSLTIHDGTGAIDIAITMLDNEVHINDIVEIIVSNFSPKENVHIGSNVRVLVSPKRRDVNVCTLPEFRFWFDHEIIRIRSTILALIREFFVSNDFLEVQTPFVQFEPDISPVYQFTTTNQRGGRYYLRISPEEYLKRLITVGFNSIFEIATNFRDDIVDQTHNPEFTSLEFYRAYEDMSYGIDLVERLMKYLCDRLQIGSTLNFCSSTVDLSFPWQRMSFRDLLKEKFGVDIQSDSGWMNSLARAIPNEGKGINELSEDAVLESAMSNAVADHINPVIITEFPMSLKTTFITDGLYAKRSEIYIRGMEIANLGCDIHQADELHNRYTQTLAAKRQKGFPCHDLDESLLLNYSYGTPPMVGAGIGIDRLVMLLTGQNNIGHIILYPHPHGEY